MTDMTVACSAGYIRGYLCQDLNQMEQSGGEVYIPIAIQSRTENVIFMQLDRLLISKNIVIYLYI